MSDLIPLATATLKGPHVDFAGALAADRAAGRRDDRAARGPARLALGARAARARAQPRGAGTALGLTIWQWSAQKSIVSGALRIDDSGAVLNLILIAGGACTVLLAWRSLAAREAAHGEFHALLLTSIGGMSLLAARPEHGRCCSSAWSSCRSRCTCCARPKCKRERSLESGLKYLIIGSVGSATLLYGLALIYGATGVDRLHGASPAHSRAAAWRPTR